MPVCESELWTTSVNARQNGKWGKGITAANTVTTSYILPSFGCADSTSAIVPSTGPLIATVAPAPPTNPVTGILSSPTRVSTFSDAPRTAPYNLYGPGNYQLDFALVRCFPLHITEASKLDFRAEWYNVTNHTLFAVASTAVGNSSFGHVTSNPILNRKSAQFSARIEF